jgi:hypothetical protein
MADLDLNNKELAVLRALAQGPATLVEISRRFRRADDADQANSWARNSVRKPLRLGLIRKVARGTYGLTAKGRALGVGVKPVVTEATEAPLQLAAAA